MRDCGNAEMRDRLPDLLHDGGSQELEHVRAHVSGCDACAAELAMLRAVRRVAVTPRVDAARIAAVIPPYRRRSLWTRATQASALPMAAAIVLAVGVGTFATTAGPEHGPPDTSRASVVAAAPAELGLGTPLGDLSESDLQDLLGDLGELEAVTSTESDVIVIPALDGNGV